MEFYINLGIAMAALNAVIDEIFQSGAEHARECNMHCIVYGVTDPHTGKVLCSDKDCDQNGCDTCLHINQDYKDAIKIFERLKQMLNNFCPLADEPFKKDAAEQ